MVKVSGTNVGRPRAELDRQVADALIEAADLLLKKKPRNEITVRELAEAAGVNKAMIGYYYQNKDNLFVALLEHLTTKLAESYQEIETEIQNADLTSIDPTRVLVERISKVFAENAAGLRLEIMEFQFNSALRDCYLERLGARPTQVMQRIIRYLIDVGVYRNDLNPAYAALSMQWMMTHGIMTQSVMEPVFKLKPGPLGENDHWAEFIGEIFDRGMRAAKESAPPRPPDS